MRRLFIALIFLASTTPAVDLSVTPRFSLGVASGWGMTDSEVQKATNGFVTILGWSGATSKYETVAGVNIEIPVIIGIKSKPDDMIGFLVGPGLCYSQNTNTFEVNATATGGQWLKYEGEDKFRGQGAKLYLGLSFTGDSPIHGELLGYVGVANIKNTYEGEMTRSNGLRATTSGSETGTATMYGVTLGGYVGLGERKQMEIGLRAGYAGGAVKIDDTDNEQTGFLAAVEFGVRL